MSKPADMVRLPQSQKTIDLFIGPYRFLSNFYIESDGTHVEGEYQKEKCQLPNQRDRFTGLGPGEAKRAGKAVLLRVDWEEVKDHIMYDLVSKKFKDHEDLRLKLLATYPSQLIEGNSWGDTYWGVCNGVGQNVLGRILMIVREELMSECQENQPGESPSNKGKKGIGR